MFQSSHFGSNHFRLKGTKNNLYKSFFSLGGEGDLFFSLGGVDVNRYLVPGSLSISTNINNRSTANFNLLGIGGEVPIAGQDSRVEKKTCDGFDRIFGGYIADVDTKTKNCNTTLRFRVSCVDFTAILDRRLVFQIYEAQPVKDVILAIVDEFLTKENIDTSGVIVPGSVPDIEKIVCSYVKCSKVFNDITTATGLHYYIDYHKVLHFFPRSLRKSSLQLTTDCDPTTEAFCAFLKRETCTNGIRWGSLEVNSRSDELINHAYFIAGWDETAVRSETFVGDGERRTFNLKYPLSQILSKDDGTIDPDAISISPPRVTPVSIGHRDDDVEGVMFLFSKGEHEISMGDDEGLFPSLTTGEILTVQYKGQFKVITNKENSASRNRQAELENTSGKYMYVEDDETVESQKYADQYVSGLLRRFSNMPVRISVKSDENILRVGETLNVTLPQFGITSKIKDGFLVQSVSIVDIDSKIFRYSYKLISTESQGDWQEFFKRIEQFGRQLKLREQSKIIYSEDLEEGSDDPVEVDPEDPENSIWKWNLEQSFEWSAGNNTSMQSLKTQRCFFHKFPDDGTVPVPITIESGRAFHNNSYHCKPRNRIQGLI